MGNFIEKMKVAPVQQKGKNMKNEKIGGIICHQKSLSLFFQWQEQQ